MKKQYTKKQIVEAIKYWQNVLKRMDESKSPLLDACIEKFGEDVVFDDSKFLFKLNNDSMQKLFILLDQFVFMSKLKSLGDLKLFIGSPSQLNSTLRAYAKDSIKDLKDYFAVYQPHYDLTLNNKMYGVVLHKGAVFINIENHKSSTFSYAISCLCHEMIHVYDMYFGKLYAYLVWAINNHAPVDVIDYNSHFTSVFKQKKSEFYDMTHIEIQDFGNDYSFEKFNEITSKNIKSMKEGEQFGSVFQRPFSKDTIEFYKDSDLVSISDDGCSFSFSFGIPMSR